ncbi:uncharacterized protein LOC62_05G007764 [Vanrija pseudolonga]|uniref:Uncharacterized protein n=1 Tax=Vanrija pseudolonga TaxID=143232 RepID=A0AAF0YE40_9TREE|nr:hypothetical protein LOC62_05G007764 [Vanrija pseudolonga]
MGILDQITQGVENVALSEERERRELGNESKSFVQEHKGLEIAGGLAAAAALVGGGAYAYNKHKEHENQEQQQQQEAFPADNKQSFGDKLGAEFSLLGNEAKSFAQEHKTGLQVAGGIAAAAAVTAGGVYAYNQHEKNKAEEQAAGTYESFGDKAKDFGGDVKEFVQDHMTGVAVAGGVAAVAAAAGGPYAYNQHKKAEDGENTQPPVDAQGENGGWSNGKIAAVVGGVAATAAAAGGVYAYNEHEKKERDEEQRQADDRQRDEAEGQREDAERNREQAERDREKNDRERDNNDNNKTDYERGLEEHQRQLDAHQRETEAYLRSVDEYQRTVEHRGLEPSPHDTTDDRIRDTRDMK